jgi:hypothetical protein
MPSAVRVKESLNPILHNHLIIPSGSLVKVKTVLEPFAAPASHRHTNTTLFHSLLFYCLLNHLYRFVAKG